MPGRTRTRPGFLLAGAALLVLGVSWWIQRDVSPAPRAREGRAARATDPAAERAAAPVPRTTTPREAAIPARSDAPAAALHDPPYRWIEELARIEALFAEAPAEAETRLVAFLERCDELPPGSSLRGHALGMRLAVALARAEAPEAARAHLETLARELDRLGGEPASELDRLGLWERLDPTLESVGEGLGAQAAERLLESARTAGAILPVTEWEVGMVVGVAERYRAEDRPREAERYLERALDPWQHDRLTWEEAGGFERQRDRMLASLDLLDPYDPRIGVVLAEVAKAALRGDARRSEADRHVDRLLAAMEDRTRFAASLELDFLVSDLATTLESDRPDRAEALLRAAIALHDDPASADLSLTWIRTELARMLRERGRIDEARRLYTDLAPRARVFAEAALLPESRASFFEDAAEIYRHAQDTPGMLELLDELGSLDDELLLHSGALETLAHGLAEQGEGGEARRAVERSLELWLPATRPSEGNDRPSGAETSASRRLDELAEVLDELRDASEADALRRRAEALRSADPVERARALDPDERF